MKSKHAYEIGTKRIKSQDLKQYIKTNSDWIIADNVPKCTQKAITNYLKTNKISLLIDEITTEFLKGHLNPEGKISGKRIKTLPNGKNLARGGFSIFAKNLKFNLDGKTSWDVCYENSSRLKTYLYTEEKIDLEKKRKAKIVDEFSKFYNEITKRLEKDIKTKNKTEYLALYTLLKTLIRVGNLEHYNHTKHKGLTTLQKKDIKINKNKVTFQFIGKDAVPQNIQKEFPPFYITQLKKLLKSKKPNDFVFTDKKDKPIHSITFTDILYSYTKKHFYPHIIRSFYADTECKQFLKHNKKANKKQIEQKFLEIACNLGHKKYNKKKNEWEICYKVTINNYIRPEYTEKMKKLYNK